MNVVRLVSFIGLLFVLGQIYAQSDLTAKIDSLVAEAISQGAFPGAQVLVSHKGTIVHHESYGYHTYSNQTAVENHHLYDLASVTKIAAGVPVVMFLADRGLIELDAPVSSVVTDWQHGNKKDITWREALSHYAQLQPYIVFWQNAKRRSGKYKAGSFKKHSSRKYTIKITDSLFLHRNYARKMKKAIRKTDLLEERRYVYSGLTFLLLPSLIKQIAGISLDQFLEVQLYSRLSLERLCFRPMDRFPIEEIVPTELDTFFRHQLVHGTVHDEAAAMLNGLSCNAGLFSNAESLAKLSTWFLDLGIYEGDTLVSPDLVEEFTRCQYCHLDNRRGLGFDKPMIEYESNRSYVAASASPASYGHSGFTGTFVWMDPTYDLVVVFLSNRVHPTRDNRKLYSSNFRPQLHQYIYDWVSSQE